VRYFGGVKLGVGGLVRAYKTAAKLALESSKIQTKTINDEFILTFEYKDMNRIQRVIKKHNIPIIDQKLELNCQYTISMRKSRTKTIIEAFEELRCVRIINSENVK